MPDSPSSDLPTLRGRSVLITGAGRGLGAATAQVLAEAGARLALADRDEAAVHRQASALAERGVETMALPLDVRDAAQCEAAVAQVVAHMGRLDALVNNAAIDVTAPLMALAVADWERVLATNLFAPLVLCKYAAAHMAPRGGGDIVNICSTAAKRAWANASAYHATKWGLLGLSHALHAELRAQDIRVTAIVAGGMRTPFLLERFPDIDITRLQEPRSVALAVRFALQQPAGSCIPELMVLPTGESSWP